MKRPALLAVLGGLIWQLAAAVPLSTAEPDPYGPASSETSVVLRSDGSYDVLLRQRQNLVREFRFRFGGAVHDGFRLADDNRLPPPYLRATYTLTSAQAGPGELAPQSFIRTNHRWAAEGPYQVYSAGDHEITLNYRITGASRPVRDGWVVHLRLLDIDYEVDDVVTIDAAPVRPRSLLLRCVRYPQTRCRADRVLGRD
jgi:hypothetical protein